MPEQNAAPAGTGLRRGLFPWCEAHTREAEAVQRVLEWFLGKNVVDLDPDTSIGEVLQALNRGDRRAEVPDSLDRLELQIALEEEFGEDAPSSDDVSVEAWELTVLRALLGPAAQQSGWAPATIWVRSVRGVINERVRWRGECTCVVEQGRRTRA